MLNNLGYSDSYTEVQRLEASILLSNPEYVVNSNPNIVYDNCDKNLNTVTGKGTFHETGGVLVNTPGEESQNRTPLKRCVKIPSAALLGAYGKVELKNYKKTTVSGFKSMEIQSLRTLIRPSLSAADANKFHCLTDLWLSNFILGSTSKLCPAWTGFMQSCTAGSYSTSQV